MKCPRCECVNIDEQHVEVHDVIHCICNGCGQEWIE
jgi:phage FluMu protein Com